ncbi:rubrerythrin [Streptomyces sp. NPDC059629]|uniref:rubrerythrin n=1 Tax=Streptomyces sp. NPDC059629 TaxID=3346889 RepID=UPI003693A83A
MLECFTAESAAVQLYRYHSQSARIEGRAETAEVFEELAETTACVAHGYLDLLEGTDVPPAEHTSGEARLNLAAAVAAVLRDVSERFPQLRDLALENGEYDTASWISTVCALKGAHLTKLDGTLAAVTGGAPRARPVAAGIPTTGERP